MTQCSTVIGETSMPVPIQEDGELPVIWVNQFNEEAAREFFYDFSSFISDDKIGSIVVYIDSNGGEMDAMFSMAELIENSSKPVITVNAGKALSAGAILFALGSERWVAPASRTMFHNIQVGILGKDIEETARYVKEVSRMNDIWIKRVVKKSKLTQKQFNSTLKEARGELYLDAKQMLKHGFADHIGLPLIKETRQWILDT